ncbi:Fanconi anemia group J protein homolog [Ixodes scapularis]|uniref:Fanconi anemia group J protein homolog n=1 Tax=Ixodes scapularis TaxID=6945 RepID=UPI001C38BCD8|nr:Fanconi anemia group J protein homolog [Ixodes scapularis]
MTCMDSSYAMKSVSSCTHSIVLASGTLSPMSSYEKELGVFFTHKVSAKEHVVSKRHFFVRRISHSLKGDKEFYMNYSACQNEELLKAVGSVVYESTKILKKNVGETKAGVLCFFPSYKLLQTCPDVWRKVPLWPKLVKVVGGHLFLEDSENSDLLFHRYKTALIDGEPGTVALFLVVHRGKMSEGVDFSDSLARLVVSVGLPYPSYHSPDVKVKVEFNRSRGGDGDEWYKTQAMRALNQSVGRCKPIEELVEVMKSLAARHVEYKRVYFSRNCPCKRNRPEQQDDEQDRCYLFDLNEYAECQETASVLELHSILGYCDSDDCRCKTDELLYSKHLLYKQKRCHFWFIELVLEFPVREHVLNLEYTRL